MTSYNELRDGQEFYGNGYKKGYKEGYKQAILDGKTNFSRTLGEWLWVGHDGAKLKWSCSSCGRGVEDQENFCPNCGVKMKKLQTQKFADNDTAYGGLASAT